jgi:putative transposase
VNNYDQKAKKTPDVSGEMIKQLLRENGGPQALFNKGGLYDQHKKLFIEMVLNAEID